MHYLGQHLVLGGGYMGWLFKASMILLIFTFVFGAGVFVGYAYQNMSDLNSQDIAYNTCEYSNKLTDIINSQSELIEVTLNNGFNYTRLDKLSCDLIKRK